MILSEDIKLASIGKRFIAGLIDYALIFAIMYFYIDAFGKPNDEGGLSVSGVMVLPINLAWFLTTIGFEQMFGSTLGNGILGIKPMHHDGINKPNIIQSTQRHLLDPIDMFFFGLVGYLNMKNSPQRQRLGDIWAKTIVIEDKK